MLEIVAAHPFITAFLAYCLIDVVHTAIKNLTGRGKVPNEVDERLQRIEEHMGIDGNEESVLQRIERLEAMSGAGPFRVRAPQPQPEPKRHHLYLDTLDEKKKER